MESPESKDTSNDPGNESICLGPFSLRPQSGELFRDGELVKLPPQPYKVLLFLVRNAGRLVERKEIVNEIWGTDTFVDFDKGLNLCIKQIREALGDDAQAPKYIATLPRRGYRFIAEVGGPPVEEKAAAEPGQQPRPRLSRRTILTGALAILAIIAVGAVLLIRSRTGAATPPAGKAMLVVLPFENLTGDPGQDYFSDGMTEEMITRIGALEPKRLGVIARTTALTYKKTGKDIRQIGSELGVNYVLEGSVRREKGRLRITSQLIKVDDQTHLWAENYDRDENDVLGIQTDVAARVASSLSLQLLPSFSSDAASGKFAKASAFDAYLKGRYVITKDTPEDLERSLPYFDQAIAEDPQFAPAYAAQVEAMILSADWTGGASRANLPKAKAAALKAIELDPAFAEGHAALGSVQLWLEWNKTDAEISFKRAVELNPNNPLTRLNYGRCLLSQGKIDEGSLEVEAAVHLDPVSLLTTGIAAYAYLRVGNYDRAIALARRMLELEPKSPAARECLFSAYINKGDYTNALTVVRERMTINGAKPEEIAKLSVGTPKEAIETRFRQILDNINTAKAKGEDIWTLQAASIAVMLGDKDKAFGYLEQALNDKASFMLFLELDPIWDSLRGDERFRQFSK